MTQNIVEILNFKVSNKLPLFLIAGPCSIESKDHAINHAGMIKDICKKLNINFVYKSSFDKANRTSTKSFRGVGLEKGLSILSDVKKSFNLPILTDVHETHQCKEIEEIVDIIQIPAFLCRQTDLIKAACKTGKIVNIKKGQFLAPWDIKGVLSKTTDASEVWITERGTSFGYNTLVTDFTGLDYMLNNIDADIVFDVTHSVQKPGGNGESSGGNRGYVPGLSRAGAALGVTNFFMEVHNDPDNAPSDGPNMVKIEDFEKIVSDIVKINGVI